MSGIGLTTRHIEQLHCIFARYLSAGEVILYGSRAKGTHHTGSDVDLVVADGIPAGQQVLEMIRAEINESDFPYLCDIQSLEAITHLPLKAHIERVGVPLFRIDNYGKDTS